MSEYDQRQYRLMLEQLTAFQSGQIYIDRLIGNLQGLLNALQSPDSTWKQSFLSLWGQLEDARAMALFRGAENLNEQESIVVGSALAKLKPMVLEKIDDADLPRNINRT